MRIGPILFFETGVHILTYCFSVRRQQYTVEYVRTFASITQLVCITTRIL